MTARAAAVAELIRTALASARARQLIEARIARRTAVRGGAS